MTDDKNMLSPDALTNILAAAYTSYSTNCKNPISINDFYEKFRHNAASFHDLVCGNSEN